MKAISIIFAGVASVTLMALFAVTYLVDRKEFNKGVCPKCGSPLEIIKNEGGFCVYACPSDAHFHHAIVGNPYLNWRYGRKLRKGQL